MESLRDQLLKAGFVDKKRIKKAEHEDRKKRKSENIKKQEEKRKNREKEWEIKQKDLRKKQLEKSNEKQLEKIKKEKYNRINNLIKTGVFFHNNKGSQNFYFVTAKFNISYLKVDEKIAKKLEKGELAIVNLSAKSQTEDFGLINGKTARKIKLLDETKLLFFNG